jgi:hypothetical protein
MKGDCTQGKKLKNDMAAYYFSPDLKKWYKRRGVHHLPGDGQQRGKK